MKKLNQYIICLFLLHVFLTSCNNFDDINTNPNAANNATPALLATKLLLNITKTGGSKNFVYDNFLNKQLAWGEGMESYQYNWFERTDFTDYKVLTNCAKMVEQASDDQKDAYQGLAYFMKAYKLFYFSLEVGDIPYSEALQGEVDNIKPKYDTQKEVMLSILDDLDKAYESFSLANNFEGDPILKGNTDKWKKTITAFRLKVLINLSKKESDPDLKVKERFARLVSSATLMESNDDNFQLVYADKANQVYPFHNTQTKHAGYSIMSSTIIDVFKEYKDYRLFYYAKPAKVKTDEGIDASEWDAYIGINPALPFENIKSDYSNGKFSGLNARYTDLPSGEPLIRIGYAEQNFNLAEAALRGWISGDASVYYKKGIEASMNFIVDKTPDDVKYHYGRKLTPEVISDYLQSPAIQLGSDKEDNIKKVLTQKYLASFLQHPYDAYYDYRRTGYPVLPIDPNTNLNTNKNTIPLRWMYPMTEYSFNKENVDEAVKRQFNGVDDINKAMWILQ